MLNVSANCVDRHLATRGDQTAIIWEGDDPNVSKKITYRELHAEVIRCSGVLRGLGVAKGDRVLIYHSVSDKQVVGIAEVSREHYPDPVDNEKGHWVLGAQNGVLWHRVFFDWLEETMPPDEGP